MQLLILQICGITICVYLPKLCSWLWPRMSGWPFPPNHQGFYENLFDSCLYKQFINLDELYKKTTLRNYIMQQDHHFKILQFDKIYQKFENPFLAELWVPLGTNIRNLLCLHFTNCLNKLEYLSLTSFKELLNFFQIRIKTMD